jgi:hypothetical protein
VTQEREPRFSEQDWSQLLDWALLFGIVVLGILVLALVLGIVLRIVTVVGGV